MSAPSRRGIASRVLARCLTIVGLSVTASGLLACSLSDPTLDAYARGTAGSSAGGTASGGASGDGGAAAQGDVTAGSSAGGSSAAGSPSSCAPCDTSSPCSSATDCKSGVCALGSCQAPTCLDRVTNGNETSTDCGGSCLACGLGLACKVPRDCASGACADVCVAPTCSDMTKNQSESDVDCGGPCAPCVSGGTCLVAADCDSNVCTAKQCASATCKDKVQNQGESDVDCGGKNCPACAINSACASATDCSSGDCESQMCVPASASGIALSRSGWIATTSATNTWSPTQAIDGDYTTRWTYGADQAPGMYFTVDLGAPRYFFSILLDSTVVPGDAAAGFDLYLSLDGKFGKPARSVVGSPTATMTFDTAAVARYVRFQLNQTATTWWSIDEIAISQ